jgi:hypothetical protein
MIHLTWRINLGFCAVLNPLSVAFPLDDKEITPRARYIKKLLNIVPT